MNEAARPTPTPPRGQSDDTVVLKAVKTPTQPRPSVQKKGDRTSVWIGTGVALGVLIGGVGLYLWPSSPLPSSPWPSSPWASAPVVVAPPAPAIPKIQIERANAQQILTRTVREFTIYRLLENPGVLVLDFASLAHQGRMLDRIAAHVEKAETPRDRLLNDAELAQSVKSIGETPHGYYYGHDYSAESLLYFFDRARRDKTVLKDEEVFLRSLLEQEGWLMPGYKGGLISLPVVGADGNITQLTRTTILYHELAHGEYFANPDYAAYVNTFWKTIVAPKEQDGIRSYLISQGYDGQNDELVENEAQAYLMFTTDPQFFAPALVGMTAGRRNELQVLFHAGLKPGWLKDLLATLMPARHSADRR